MTPAQLTALKNFIAADGTMNTKPNNSDGHADIAILLNAAVAPTFWVFRTNVSNEEIGDAMNGTEVAGLSSLGMQRLQVLAAYSGGTQNPARADRRAAFDQVFSGAGGTVTRPALAVVWRRVASVFEKLFATGTGSTASPATMVLQGPVSALDVEAARSS